MHQIQCRRPRGWNFAPVCLVLTGLVFLGSCGGGKKNSGDGDLWGATWTVSEINSPGFGVLIKDSDDDGDGLNIDLVQVRILHEIFTPFMDPALAAGASWTTPENATVSDDTHATFDAADGNTNDAFLALTDFGFALPPDAVISGIDVRIEGNGDSINSADRQLEIQLTKDGSTPVGDPKTPVTLSQNFDTEVTTPPPPFPDLAILTEALPSATVDLQYTEVFRAAGGTGIYDWTVTLGTLPDGLELDTLTGALTGTPEVISTFDFTVEVVSGRMEESKGFSIRIGDNIPTPNLERISIASDGSEANGSSGDPAITPDGRFVSFTSFASNLAASLPGGDLNDVTDVFVRDLLCQTTELISVATDGTPGDMASWGPSLSALRATASGNVLFVAYVSEATTLVADDTNELRDAFVTTVLIEDPPACTITPIHTARVSVTTGGEEANRAVSGPAINATGDHVVYFSVADNLVEADTNGASDVFATELFFSDGALTTGRTRRMSTFRRIADRTGDIFSEATIGVSSFAMTNGAHIGQKVEIMSGAGQGQIRTIESNDATTFTLSEVWQVIPDTTSFFRVYSTSTGAASSARISANGQVVGFSWGGTVGPDDTNFAIEAVIKNRLFGGFMSISVFGHSKPSNGQSNLLALNDDSSLALFSSFGTNLVPDDTNFANDLFLRKRFNRVTTRVHLADDGSEADANFGGREGFFTFESAGFSNGGRLIVFESSATNLIPPDLEFNNVRDIFLRDTLNGTTERLSTGMDGVEARLGSFGATISLDGSTVVFSSDADNLVPDDTNFGSDVFLVTTSVVESPVFLTHEVPPAQTGAPYQSQLLALGGTRPLLYSVSAEGLPPGITLDSRTGELMGLPVEPGSYTFSVTVLDSANPLRASTETFTLLVEE